MTPSADPAAVHPLRDFSGTVVLVGAGRMGGALLEGWLALGLAARGIAVIEPEPTEEIETLARRGLHLNPRADSLGRTAAVVLAVKPQVAAAVLPTLGSLVGGSTVVVSIMAGRTLQFLEAAFPGTAIVRAMPNTPAAVGRGITVAAPNARVSAPQRELVHALLSAVGAVEWIADETLMDGVTAVSGSGPAYVFLLAESMAKAGVAAGLPPALAESARARHGRGLGRASPPFATRCGNAEAKRHLARWHHRRRARNIDGRERPRRADDERSRRRRQALARVGGRMTPTIPENKFGAAPIPCSALSAGGISPDLSIALRRPWHGLHRRPTLTADEHRGARACPAKTAANRTRLPPLNPETAKPRASGSSMLSWRCSPKSRSSRSVTPRSPGKPECRYPSCATRSDRPSASSPPTSSRSIERCLRTSTTTWLRSRRASDCSTR